MSSRLVATIVMTLLAFIAFWDDAIGSGCSVSFVFLVLAGIIWFKWDVIKDGFYTAKGESELPIIRLVAKTISGMQSLPHDHPSRRSTSKG